MHFLNINIKNEYQNVWSYSFHSANNINNINAFTFALLCWANAVEIYVILYWKKFIRFLNLAYFRACKFVIIFSFYTNNKKMRGTNSSIAAKCCDAIEQHDLLNMKFMFIWNMIKIMHTFRCTYIIYIFYWKYHTHDVFRCNSYFNFNANCLIVNLNCCKAEQKACIFRYYDWWN